MSRNFESRPDYPVVKTKAGLLRGFVMDGIFSFYGIKYCDAKRWQMPTEVEPWEGVKAALDYGYVCPTNGTPKPSGEVLIPHRFWPENENCQYLNVWTKSIDPEAKKPVVVWYHGGGYADGSSLEQVAYEGDQLADFGDVVVVTVNHRLNILGFLDMSSFGEKYKNSVNAGMVDLVWSLKWVKENIAGFGGDPDNVLIFGQSGGGGKVCTLLQMPEAAGLFQKAVLMSGGAGASNRQGPDHRQIVLEMLKELEIPEEKVENLEKVPYSLLIRTYNRVCRRLDTAIGWGPRPDDRYVGHPVSVGFTDYAKTVPTMVTSVFGEMNGFRPVECMDDAAAMEKLKETYGENAQIIADDFAAAYPDKPLYLLFSLDSWARDGIIRFMDERAKVKESPCYTYVLGLTFDVDGNHAAWHCADIPFVFHNACRVGNCNIPGVGDRLEADMAGALVAFAATGNPNHEGMTEWRPYTAEDPATMVFDRENRCVSDLDRKLFADIAKYGPKIERSFKARVPEDDEEGRPWLY